MSLPLMRYSKRAVLFLFSAGVIITALEYLATYVDIRVFSFPEIGTSRYFISAFGLEAGLVVAYLWSIFPVLVAGGTCWLYLWLTGSVVAVRYRRFVRPEVALAAFIVLGAASLYSLPAALNDLLAPTFGGGPLVEFLYPLTLVFAGIGGSVASYSIAEA